MKKIFMLSGNHFQVAARKYARVANHFSITANYLPSNPGHNKY